jgi:hypothetical protein
MKNKKTIWFYPFVLLGMSIILTSGCKKDENIPVLTTAAVSGITLNTATCGGNITSNDGGKVTARGVCWSTINNPTVAGNKTTDGSGTGSFSSNLTGLTEGTTYYVRSYATNNSGTGYGNEYRFSTIASPDFSTPSIFDIRGNSAKATVYSYYMSVNITSEGLCWSTSINPTTSNSTNNSFSDAMTGLSTNTTYYVRAYITCNYGTFYSEQVSFNSGQLIGSSYCGGLVFYNDGNGHGFVCAPADQSYSAEWGCSGTSIATSYDLNTGAANTSAIVASCSQSSIAARICYDLVLNSYNDWYLPSEAELLLIYSNLFLQGLGNLFVNSGKYWSSSGADTYRAYTVYGGGYDYDYKNLTFGVRAIRSF